MASSSSSSSLLCILMFIAVSSVGKAMRSDNVRYDEPDDDYYSRPAPEWEDASVWGCPAVMRYISACEEYLNEHEDSPSSACCSNVVSLAAVGVEVGFQRICDCTKDLRRSFVQRRAGDEIYRKCGFEDKNLLIPIARGQCPKYVF